MNRVNRAVSVTLTSSDGKHWNAKIQDHADDNLKMEGLSSEEAQHLVDWIKLGKVAIDLQGEQVICHF